MAKTSTRSTFTVVEIAFPSTLSVNRANCISFVPVRLTLKVQTSNLVATYKHVRDETIAVVVVINRLTTTG